MSRCADEKISKTENKVTVANCVVENLDHKTGSGLGRKIGRDGGIEKKKRRESGI